MCRWIAYRGAPLAIEEVVVKPAHSLVHQSQHAHEAKCGTNGDGFGIGWYGEREEPGLYRELRPAWSDENLASLCAQVRSRLFFAHVRAATGTATGRPNCHPFAHGRFLFMHNGQVGGYGLLRRAIEALIPDDLYPCRAGTTDSEAIFLAALGRGLAEDPAGALAAVLGDVAAFQRAAGVREPLRFTAALSDGEALHAFRWASDNRAPTLYWREGAAGLTVVSEPLDAERARWRAVPQGVALTADAAGVRLTPFLERERAAA